MAQQNPTVIAVHLDDEKLRKSIDKLVTHINTKLKSAAQKFDTNVGKMQTTLNNFAASAKVAANDIKNTFSSMGMSFEQFARAMRRAAQVASSMTGATTRQAVPGTVEELKQQIAAQQRLINQQQIYSAELQRQVDLLARQKSTLKNMLTDTGTRTRQSMKENLAWTKSLSENDIAQVTRKLRELEIVRSQMSQHRGIFKSSEIQAVSKQIDRLTLKLEKMRNVVQTPKNMQGIMGMSEKTLGDISRKMQAISQYRMMLPVNSPQLAQLNNEYQRLNRLQNQLMGNNTRLIRSNEALARSFNYIRNRLIYFATFGTITNFVRQLYEVRGQYELLERSLGVLFNSFQKGSRIFQELSNMAIQSPFTLIELGTAAKQLAAYNFEATEVVNVTKRLADISAALGVPMERLVYNLGQIRAQGRLTARDARDFANAGLAIVPELAKMYTKVEKRVVSTADVYDRMTKKAVSYNDVMTVLNSVTDEGGKFFNFQAKQADTLRVQLANLTLAWNNMLNDIGKAHQSTLSIPIQLLKQLFINWRSVSDVIFTLAATFGIVKTAQMVMNRTIGASISSLNKSILADKKKIASQLERKALTTQLTQEELKLLQTRKMVTASDYQNILATKNLTKSQAMLMVAFNRGNIELKKALIRMGLLTAEEIRNINATKLWKLIWKTSILSIKSAISGLAGLFKAALPMLLISAVIELASAFINAGDAAREFNKAVSDGQKENLDSLSKFAQDYQSVADSLYEWNPRGDGGYTRGAPKDIDTEQAKKAWEAMRDEIIKSSDAGRDFVAKLELINDVNERVRKGFDYIDQIKQVSATLVEMDENAIKMQEDWSKWWNLWIANDSLIENFKDYMGEFSDVVKDWGGIDELRQKASIDFGDAKDDLEDFNSKLEDLNGNLLETAESMVNLFSQKNLNPEQEREGFNQVVNQMIQDWNLGVKEALQFRMLMEQQYANQRYLLYRKEDAANADANYRHWQEQFNMQQSMETEFLNWLTRNRFSQTQEMFKDMSAAEIQEIDWSEERWAKWAKDNADAFAKEYHLSFDQLSSLVSRANTWSINIPVFFNVQGESKNVFQQLEDADSRVQDAEKRIERLKEGIQSGKVDMAKANKELADAQSDLAKALAEGGKSSKKKTKADTAAKKAARQHKREVDAVAEALKNEISLVKEVQSNYDKLRKAGFDTTTALNVASSGYENTLKSINATLSKFGIAQFKASDFVGKDANDPNTLLDALKKQRTTLVKSGKVKLASLKDLDVEIQKLTVDAKTYNMQKITDGLNREFEKLHNDYELSVELDANPELGDMFADMFNIDRSKLPHNMADLIKESQKIVDDAISKYNKENIGSQEGREGDKTFATALDIMRGDIQKWAENAKIDVTSKFFEEIKGEQDKLREQFKKYMLETEKDLDDYVKKYGITADRIAEIEAEKQRKLSNLNNRYLDEQSRKTPEYLTKLDAINKGAAKEKDKVWFEDFKSSELYAQMFDRIEDVSTATLELLRGKVKQVKESLDELDPTQVKELTKQFAKIDEELIRRNPYKGLVKNYKEYISALKNQKQVEQDYLDAQKNYDAQMEVVAALEEQLKQKEYQQPLDKEGINSLKQEVIAARNLLKYLKQILGEKEEDNNENKEAISKFQKQAQSLANNLQDISKIVSTIGSITEALGVDEDTNEIISDIAQSIEGVSEMAQGMAQMTTNPIAGVSGIIGGLWKTVSGWFDNANKRIDRKIKKSEQAVNKLELAYIDLERAVSKSLGNAEIRARKLAIENKRLQLAQLQNQLRLEQSRSKKNRDDDKIVDLQKQIKELNGEIADMMEDITNNLLGSDIKSAAEDFVNTWVDAWRQGEDTMEALNSKFTEMIDQMIMKSLASKLVATRLKPIWDMVDSITNESSESGADITMNELKRIKELIGDKSISEAINQDLKNLYGALGIAYGSGKDSGQTLSNLQQGIQSITEDTANALEAYMNGVSQQVYLHSELLTQIRDAVVTLDLNVQTATIGQILLQLQQSHQVQMAIQNILMGWSNASGLAMRVEMI